MKKYERYKDSGVEWIGNYPSNWKLLQIRRLTEDHKQGFYSSNGYTSEGFRLVRITDLDNNGNINASSSPFVSLTETESKIFKIRKGDFLFPRTGSIGLLGIAKEDMDAAFASYLIRFRFTELVISNFMKYYFLSSVFLNGLLSELHGGVNQNVHAENIKDQLLVLPSLEQQIEISKYLDNKTQLLDTLISQKEQLITLLEEERTALINHAVTKGLDPTVPMKDSGIEWLEEIPAHWEVKKLKYIAKINNSKQSFEFNRQSEKEVVFLPMEKVSENGNITQDLRRKISEVSSGFTYFERHDVLVAKITPCFENGKGALLSNLESDFGYGSTEFHTIKASKLILKEFLYFLTKSERFMTIGEAFMSGSAGQKRVPTSFLENFTTGVPSIEEQTNIVKFIQTQSKQINTIITKTQQEIELLKEYKTALISEVVTGKVDVRGEVLETVGI